MPVGSDSASIQHLSIFDYVAVSASLENRVVEYVDELHEHFVNPVVLHRDRYMPPVAPGYSIEMKPETFARHRLPNGPAWKSDERQGLFVKMQCEIRIFNCADASAFLLPVLRNGLDQPSLSTALRSS